MDSVEDSGQVRFHGLDDGTRVKTEWRSLRYLPSSLSQQPPLSLTVRITGAPPADTEAVKIFHIGDSKGRLNKFIDN